jgi:hypothetical protein
VADGSFQRFGKRRAQLVLVHEGRHQLVEVEVAAGATGDVVDETARVGSAAPERRPEVSSERGKVASVNQQAGIRRRRGWPATRSRWPAPESGDRPGPWQWGLVPRFSRRFQ